MVRKYVDRDPANRFVQLPHKFFDTDNPNGFAGTKSWWKASQKRKREVRSKLVVHAQVRRFLQNEQKEPSKRKPALTFYQECEQRIAALGKPKLVEQFQQAILERSTQPKAYAFIN